MTYTKYSESKRRALKFESLEERRLLSAVPLSSGELLELAAKYSLPELAEDAEDLNTVVLDLAQGDSQAELKAAVADAAASHRSELIVIRTADGADTIELESAVRISLQENVSGSLAIVSLGSSTLKLSASAEFAVQIDSGSVSFGGVTFVGMSDQTAMPKELLRYSPSAHVYAEGVSFLLNEADAPESAVWAEIGNCSATVQDISEADENTLIIFGTGLVGGTVDAVNDHRIAMAAAIAATACQQNVTILGAECVKKSYPRFWEEYARLGGNYEQHLR